MPLSKPVMYDLEEVYDVVAEADEELVDKMFTKLKPVHEDTVRKLKYGKDDIDDRLVETFLGVVKEKGIEDKWGKGYLFYYYFDDEDE